jgi:hypothetical protein
MIITINNLPIGQGTDFAIASPVEGLEIPPIRTSSQNYSGRDGGRVNAQFYSQRLITINGFIIGDSCADYETARQTLQAALPIRTRLEIIIDTFVGTRYITYGNIIDFKFPIIGPKAGRYKIDIITENVYFLSEDAYSQVISKYVGGGFVLETTLPILFEAGAGIGIVSNGGTEKVYPIIEIDDSADTPRVTNVDTGEFVEFNLAMSNGDKLIIDMDNRTATLNGGSVLSLRNPSSSWWGLSVGQNRIRFDTSNGSDTGTATIIWRDAVLTI